MRKSMLAAALMSALAVAGCQVTIPNIYGGPDLTLTGNVKADMPSIQAYAASIKAGVKKNAAELRGWMDELCPYVSQAQAQLGDPSTVAFIQKGAAAVNSTQSGADKQISNVQSGLTIAAKVCATGTAPNIATAFVSGVDAVSTVQNLIKTGSAQ